MQKNIGMSAGILALLAMLMHVSSPPARERADGRTSGASSSSGSTRSKSHSGDAEPRVPSADEQLDGPWLASREFLYAGEQSVPAGLDGKPLNFFDAAAVSHCATDEACRSGVKRFFGLDQSARTYEFVIATIADPMRTRLGLATDDAINAIEEAAGNNGWEFAGQWLPWKPGISASESDPVKRHSESSSVRLQDVQPGLLTFRHQGSKGSVDPRALFVLLVGETPTAGINGLQFKMARAYMEALGAPGQVRLLAPTFSGSFYSLTELVAEDQAVYKKDKGAYEARSGTATSGTGADVLRSVLPNFYGANESLADQQQHFQEMLWSLHIPNDRAAFLIEGESAYGNEFAKSTNKKQIRVLRFPREISHLRNAYRDAVAQTNGQNAPAPDLSFSLKDTAGGDDAVPVFSETQTPLSQNAVMQQIATEIRRNRIRMVEAGATNVLDLLFVAKVIREQCPDTRLVVAFPDLLFVQALQTEPLNGILALSTYPLFFQRERWMGDPQLGVTFTDMNAEGIYNAAALIFSGPEPGNTLEDYNWQGQHRPPAWLLMLGHAGFLPVKVFPASPSPKESPNQSWFAPAGSARTVLELPSPSRPWILLTIAFAGSSLGLCWLLFYQLRHPASRFLEAVALEGGSKPDAARHFFLFAVLMILAFCQLVLYLPWALHHTEKPAILEQILLVSGLVASVLAGAAIVTKRLWRSGLRGIRITVVCTSLIFVAAALLWGFCCARGGDTEGFFFSFRSVEMQFGSSPIFPILAPAVGLLIFAVVHLKRFQLVARLRPCVFTSTFDHSLQGALRKARREMNRVLSLPCGTGWKKFRLEASVAAAALLFGCLVLQVPLNFSSIDGRAYDILCISLQLALIGALLLTGWQIRSAWGWFHTFLSSLSGLPIAHAFVRMTEAGHNGPIWTRRLNLLSLELPIESAKMLHDMHLLIRSNADTVFSVTGGEVEAWYCRYRNAVEQLLKSETAEPPLSRRQIAARFSHLKFTGASIANRISQQVLMPYWRESHLAAPVAESDETKTEKTQGPPSFEDLAQRFVAYHFSCFVLYSVRHIQNLLWFLSAGFVLLVFSLNSYDFQSPQQIGRFLILLFVPVSFIAWRCLAGMERNAILSRIAGTEEGELNKGFYLKLASYGALPVIGLLASQFPAISKFLFSWVEPALEALK